MVLLRLIGRTMCDSARGDHIVNVAPAWERAGDFGVSLGAEFDEAMSYPALRKAKSIDARLT